MKYLLPVYLFILPVFLFSCKEKKESKPEPASFLTAKEAVRLNQLVYKTNAQEAFAKNGTDFKVVFEPLAVNGNYAIIVKKKEQDQYALVIRGSVMEFSNEGFQNFILQDFNIFRIKPWAYADSVKEAYLSIGTYTGFQNLLQLRDTTTKLSIKEFIEQKIPATASLIITGHSLGGNLAYPVAGYLKKELNPAKRLQLITFGAPAAGNAAFVKDMEGKFPDAERHAASGDIAVAFPDMEQMGDLAKASGLEPVLQLDKLDLSILDTTLKSSNLLNLAGKLLKKTGFINETNTYTQSSKHLRRLNSVTDTLSSGNVSAETLFNRAYHYHRVDAYAALLGVDTLKD
ncbi:MAG: hypothetical protein JNM88_19645 [Chitinophagaceae bacterium]|nr:hypothetical protein [Chitinophagaceae bacterium]